MDHPGTQPRRTRRDAKKLRYVVWISTNFSSCSFVPFVVNSSISSESLLSLQEILHQRLIKTHARIHRHVVDVRFGTFTPIHFTKLTDRTEIIRPHAAGVERELVVLLHVFEFDNALERKMHFGLV